MSSTVWQRLRSFSVSLSSFVFRNNLIWKFIQFKCIGNAIGKHVSRENRTQALTRHPNHNNKVRPLTSDESERFEVMKTLAKCQNAESTENSLFLTYISRAVDDNNKHQINKHEKQASELHFL